MKNGIFFLTYDGYYNFTSGIGTQTKIFLKGIEEYYQRYRNIYGEFEINLIVPDFDDTVYGYNEQDIKYANGVIHALGGKVYKCTSSLDKEGTDFWTVSNWRKISASAASIVLKESVKYQRIIVIAIDPPFLHTPRHISICGGTNSKIKSVILMYTSAYIHDKKLSYDRLRWEYSGLISAREYENVKIGNVCNYMHDHFVNNYKVNLNSFVPYPSSLFIEDSEFDNLSQEQILSVLNKHNIPPDKNIVFAFGRAAWVKGFDTLLKGFALLQDKVHLVLLATEFEDSKGRIKEYEMLIQKEKLNCSLIADFTRELPMALCQYERCKIVVCPSRREPFSNIPLEVGLWAKEQGPVVLASNIGGFIEQINDEGNGFLFNVDDHEDLARKMGYILQLPEESLKSIKARAYHKVVTERDFFKNFERLLNSLWSP